MAGFTRPPATASAARAGHRRARTGFCLPHSRTDGNRERRHPPGPSGRNLTAVSFHGKTVSRTGPHRTMPHPRDSEEFKTVAEDGFGGRIDRRCLLQHAVLLGVSTAVPGRLVRRAEAADPDLLPHDPISPGESPLTRQRVAYLKTKPYQGITVNSMSVKAAVGDYAKCHAHIARRAPARASTWPGCRSAPRQSGTRRAVEHGQPGIGRAGCLRPPLGRDRGEACRASLEESYPSPPGAQPAVTACERRGNITRSRVRARAKIGTQNLTHQMRCFVHRERMATPAWGRRRQAPRHIR